MSIYVIMTSLESNSELDEIIKNYIPPEGMDLIGVISIIKKFKGGSPKNLGKLDKELNERERREIYNSVISSLSGPQLTSLANNIITRLGEISTGAIFASDIRRTDSGTYIFITRSTPNGRRMNPAEEIFHLSIHPSRGGNLEGINPPTRERLTLGSNLGVFHVTHHARTDHSIVQGRTVFFSLELNSDEIKGKTRFFLQAIGTNDRRGSNSLAIRYGPGITAAVNDLLRTIEIDIKLIPRRFIPKDDPTKQLKKDTDDKDKDKDKGGPERRSLRIRTAQTAGKKKKRKTQKNKK